MKKSNIFAYIELSKFVEELKKSDSSPELKEKLKGQSAYFKIIESRYFSEPLVSDWESILAFTKQKGASVDEAGNVIASSIANSINGLSNTESQYLVNQLYALFEKVKLEFQ